MTSYTKQFAACVRTKEDMHAYQGMAVDFCEAHPFCALFIDLGLGKTVICLTLIERLLMRFLYNRCLVIAPLRVASQTWPTEKSLWRHAACMSHVLIRPEAYEAEIKEAGRAARRDSVWQGMGSPKMVDKDVRSAMAAKKEEILRRLVQTPASFHIINREAVEWLQKFCGKKWPFDFVIIDESSAVKDHSTNRFKALARARKHMTRLIELTATPTAESYMGLFAQIYLLDQGARFGRGITKFREEYFNHNKYTFSYTLKEGAADKIIAKIADITLTMKAADYLDIEQPLIIPRFIDMTPPQMQQYREFESDFILSVADAEDIEAMTAADLSSKLLQMASGVVYDKEKNFVHIHDHKIEELSQIQEEALQKPIIVCYWWKSSLVRLSKAFPNAVRMDVGGKAVDSWNDGEIPMLLLHPASAGHGLNLQHGGHLMVFFDMPWSYELYLQVIGRIARQGQKDVVRVFQLITRGTADEAVVESLNLKEAVQNGFFRRLKALHKKLKNQMDL